MNNESSTTQQQLGPADIERLLRELLNSRQAGAHLRWINASVGNEVRLIAVGDVLYFQADTKYTRVVLRDSEALIRKSLRELQEELDPSVFWTIHRSTIVNVNALSVVVRDEQGRLKAHLRHRGDKLAISDARAHLFRQM